MILLITCSVNAQLKQYNLKKVLAEIKEGTFKGPILDNELVKEYIDEYELFANSYGVSIQLKLQKINFILIEPSSNIPPQLTGNNLGKIDLERKMILLSKNCLLDNNILKATLFRELSHYFGVPYKQKGSGIMALEKPKDYSYDWLSNSNDKSIMELEYFKLFSELKQYIAH